MGWSEGQTVTVILLALLGVAAVTDYKDGKIPPWLTLYLMAVGIVHQCMAGKPFVGPAVVVGAFIARGMLGQSGADVKMMAAMLLCLGFRDGLVAIALSQMMALASWVVARAGNAKGENGIVMGPCFMMGTALCLCQDIMLSL